MTERDVFWATVFGALLHGVVVVVSLTVLGVVYHTPVISALALASGACAYVCFMLQITVPRAETMAYVFTALSVLCGAAALFAFALLADLL